MLTILPFTLKKPKIMSEANYYILMEKLRAKTLHKKGVDPIHRDFIALDGLFFPLCLRITIH
jgi:hypothetical protein